MEKVEQVKPLTSAPPCSQQTTTNNEEAVTADWTSYLLLDNSNWRCIVCCCGCCSAVVTILGLILLVLTFTVFKVKNPTLALNNIYINNLNIFLSTPNSPISLNATLIADISIKNPNKASLQFDSSTTKFYYMGETVGVAYAPWTKVSAMQTVQMNLTVDVLVDQVAVMTNATGTAFLHGYVNLTSYTDARGKVSVMRIFKREIDVVMNCSMSVDVPLSSQRVKYKVCQAYVE